MIGEGAGGDAVDAPAGLTKGTGVWPAISSWLRAINPLVWPIIAIVIGLTLFSDKFLTVANQFNVLRAVAVLVIIGVGQTFVMTSRNIDLSVGSMLGLVMGLTGSFVLDGGPVWAAMLLAVLLGGTLGLVNGLVITVLRVPALLATLGTFVLYRGVIQQIMYGSYHVRFPESLVRIGQGSVGPVPNLVLFAVGAVVVGLLLMRYTKFGRYTIAIGGNPEAALIAGIRVHFWTVAVFVFQGLLVGFAAFLMMGRLNAAHPNAGQGLELQVIAGVVLGGTSLFGGYGALFGMALGMYLIGILENGLLLSGAGFFWQQILLGIILILAVSLQMWRQGRTPYNM